MPADNDMTADLYTLVDEDGVEQQFELLDTMDVDDDRYYALVPYYADPSQELSSDTELVVLKSEYERIGNMFLERLNKLYDDE